MVLPKQVYGDLLAGVSLANLCFLDTWVEVLGSDARSGYLSNISASDCVAAMVMVAAVGFAAGAAIHVMRASAGPRAAPLKGMFLTCLFFAILIPLNSLRVRYDVLRLPNVLSWAKSASLPLQAAAVLLVAIVAFALIRQRHRMFAFATNVLLAASPFILVTFGRSAWAALTYSERVIEPLSAADVPVFKSHSGRVVIMVFDELDERLAFNERPRDLALPELDRLRQEALFADSAYSPGPGTLQSMPGLIVGRQVAYAAPSGPNELLLSFVGGRDTVQWSTQPNMFTRARGLGLNTAIAGWYHPYCRVLRSALTRCFAQPYVGVMSGQGGRTLGRALIERLVSISPWDLRREHLEAYNNIMTQALKAVADSSLGLVLLHLPVPHLPPIYDRRTGSFTVRRHGYDVYFDNLALADRTLGELRRAMEANGTWTMSSVLVTSDHSWRASGDFDGKHDPRIPFIVKLSGRADTLTFTKPVYTTVASDLVVTLLKGTRLTVTDLARWLTARLGH